MIVSECRGVEGDIVRVPLVQGGLSRDGGRLQLWPGLLVLRRLLLLESGRQIIVWILVYLKHGMATRRSHGERLRDSRGRASGNMARVKAT